MTGGVTEVRLLTDAEARASVDLGAESFGGDGPRPDPLPSPVVPGRETAGLLVDGELVARAAGRSYATWWGGRAVPTVGIASVGVQMERRGEGLLTPVLDVLHDRARERGEVLGLLYPTAQGIYRGLGYEWVVAYDQVEMVTRDLAAARLPEGTGDTSSVTLRRGRADDYAAVRATYAAWAQAQDGPLTREGPLFPHDDEAFGQELDGSLRLTLAVSSDDPRSIEGYALWSRSEGYHGGLLTVDDLVAITPAAHVALLRALGSWHTVAPRTLWWTSGPDTARLLLPTSAWRVVDHRPAMLAVLDVVGALEARGYPVHLTADLVFAVTGRAPVAGTYRLQIAGGRARCARVEGQGADGIRTLSPRALALSYAGAAPSTTQRSAGLLHGPADDDALWDAIGGGRERHLRDYF